MASRNALSKALAGVAIAGALSLTSLFTGVVSADTGINIGVGELQECTISKSMDADGDVDGSDFLVWQTGDSPSVSVGDLADWQANYGQTAASDGPASDPEWKYISVRRY